MSVRRIISSTIAILLSALILVQGARVGLVYGLSPSDAKSLGGSSELYWPGQCAQQTQLNTGNDGGGLNVVDTNIWNSGLQPPYYLEEFAINVLQDLAGKLNTPQSNTVTKEHVIALIGWFWEEGGDIMNSGLFNPLNTGLNDPELLATGHNASGLESFKSFDAGVEALAISFTGNNQNRIAKALADPSKTAEQVMDAVTYYQSYPGNKEWAEDDVQNQAGYHNKLLTQVEQARNKYASEASTVLGTPAHEAVAGPHVDVSLLKYNTGAGGAPTSGPIVGSQSGVNQGGACAQAGTATTNCSSTAENTSSVSPQAGSSTAASANATSLGNVVACIAKQELATWQAGPPGGPAQYCKKYIDGLGQTNWCEEWCADFASWVYNQAGYPLRQGSTWRIPAVATIRDLGDQIKGEGRFDYHTSGYTPQIGDLVIHEKGGSSHVNIVVGVSGNTITMIGGDQGSGPYGGPNSRSNVSQYTQNGFYSGDISGYVTPLISQ